MNFNSNKNYKVSLKHHVIFWLVYFLITVIRWGGIHNDYIYTLKTTMIGFPIHITLSYLNVYVLMPKFVYKKKYLTYSIALLFFLFIMLLIKYNLSYYLVDIHVFPEGDKDATSLTWSYAINTMIGELYVVTFVTAIKITLDFLKESKRVAALEKAKLETELLFLKTQISPHFFFNTLNNIYSLAVEKSSKTKKVILRLSELMRYLLYETKHKRQTIENEILCIQNYLDLERIRHGELLEINMSVSGDIQDKTIAPILLLSFVENSFKHGVNKNIGKVKIDINFTIKEDFLYFTISNPMPANVDDVDDLKQSSGIGIENVKKRLALGYNKEDYRLNITNDNNLFIVDFKIKVL